MILYFFFFSFLNQAAAMSTNVGCAHEYISSCQSEYKLLWISVTRILDRALDLASFKVLFSELIEAVHIIGENNHHDFM